MAGIACFNLAVDESDPPAKEKLLQQAIAYGERSDTPVGLEEAAMASFDLSGDESDPTEKL